MLGTTYSSVASISGTSMSAPHVAAAAAYYADVYSLTSPSAIEQAIRGAWATLGSDRNSATVHFVQF